MAEHITITKAEGTWVVRAGGAVLGETSRAISLTEGSFPPIIYFPREDFALVVLEKSDTKSHCPHKGEASYYSIQTKSALIKDAAWSYEAPLELAEEIKGYLAFYPTKVTIEQI